MLKDLDISYLLMLMMILIFYVFGQILIWMVLKQVIILKKLLNITKNTRIQDFSMKT